MRRLLALILLVMAGCASKNFDGYISSGEVASWPGVVLDGPVVVESGGRLEIRELLSLRGPLIVRGELAIEGGFLQFTGSREEASIVIDGGRLVVVNSSPEGVRSLNATGGHVEWIGGTLALGSIRAQAGASLLFGNTSLVPFEEVAPSVFAADSDVKLVNVSATGFRYEAQGSATIRAINNGVPPTSFSGSGTIERGWHIIVQPVSLTGARLTNETIVISSVARGYSSEATSGVDGRAYIELIEVSVTGGSTIVHNPYVAELSSRVGRTGFVAMEEEQEVKVIAAT